MESKLNTNSELETNNLHKAEVALKESEQKYKKLFDDDLTGNFISSVDGSILLCNPALVKIFGFESCDELMKENITSFYKKTNSRDEFLDLLREKKKIEHYELEYIRRDGTVINVIENVVGEFDDKGELVRLKGYLYDNTDSKRTEEKQALLTRILSILNRPNEWQQLLKDIVDTIKDYTGFDAIGIRLQEGEDYPYFETTGFTPNFIESEKFLCARNQSGQIMRDTNGNPILECMCGNIISCRTDSSLPFFTKVGSFWSNNTTELLASTSEEERQAHTRNRCNSEGYESVALIPIQSGNEVIGLLQFNDKRTNMFTLDLIEFFEKVGATVGIAFKRMQSEKVIKESEEELKTITASAMDAIMAMDNEGKISFWNPASERIFGYRAKEVLGMDLHDLLVPVRFHQAFKRGFAKLIQTGEGTAMNKVLEMYAIHKNGSEFPVELSLSPVFRNGKWQAIGIIRDITERKVAKQKLIEAKEKAEKADELKTNFLEQMSHEIRTPLHILLSYSNLIREELGDSIDQELIEGFEGIDTAGKRIIRTIDLILNVSELQTGGYEPSTQKVNIKKDILDKIYSEHLTIAKSKGLIFTLESETTEDEVSVDTYSATQIFTNLIDNAIKFTHEGKVEIRIKRSSSNQLIITISDTGVGVSQEYLPNVFEPFSQEIQGRTRPFEGNGLGLTLVKRYCEINNAEISVDSTKNTGTTFTITFNNSGDPDEN